MSPQGPEPAWVLAACPPLGVLVLGAFLALELELELELEVNLQLDILGAWVPAGGSGGKLSTPPLWGWKIGGDAVGFTVPRKGGDTRGHLNEPS